MGTFLTAVLFVLVFGGYIVLAAMADHAEYKKEQHDKYGDNP